MFVDSVEIVVQAGRGGHGSASFRREKYLPFGGPDGGDGGKGGNVFLVVRDDMRDLSYFRNRTSFKAMDGGRGGKQKMHGANASDLEINVPQGTTVYVKDDGKQLLIADLVENGQKVMVAMGGRGGLGNVHFATSTRQAPKIAQPGEEGEKKNLILEYNLVVDVCIIGHPNSGKSALLAAISKANPDIAEYPFTTKEPVLGIVEQGSKRYTWVELPGLAKDAHQGKGLGNGFLRHARRASVLLYLIEFTGADIRRSLNELVDEVSLYNSSFLQKRSVVVVNKIDIANDEQLGIILRDLSEYDWPVYFISARDRLGLGNMLTEVHKLVDEDKGEPRVDTPEVIFRPRPKDKLT